jgi:hypothetical protein
MSRKTREYVMLVIALLLGGAYGWLSLEWSDPELYGGGAALIVLICGIGLPWTEFAPDGAFRRRPQA